MFLSQQLWYFTQKLIKKPKITLPNVQYLQTNSAHVYTTTATIKVQLYIITSLNILLRPYVSFLLNFCDIN